MNTVKTLLAYGYIIEAPTHDVEELIRKRLNGIFLQLLFDCI
jgi:hypothetical protein